MSTYFQKLQGLKNGTIEPDPKKPRIKINQVSEKRAAKIKEEKEFRGQVGTEKQIWFERRRTEMTGKCACGCNKPSSKYDDKNYRSSIAHIFPQRIFKSVRFHHLNWVERSIWASNKSSSCHTNMDNRSMDLWPDFQDWPQIVEKFHELSKVIPENEKSNKFYRNLKWLVDQNS